MNPAASSPEAVTASGLCGQQVIHCKATFCPNDTDTNQNASPAAVRCHICLVKPHLYGSGPAMAWHWNIGAFSQGTETLSSEGQEEEGCKNPFSSLLPALTDQVPGVSLGKGFCKGRNTQEQDCKAPRVTMFGCLLIYHGFSLAFFCECPISMVMLLDNVKAYHTSCELLSTFQILDNQCL